jgi:hypothetical protein
MMVEKSSVRVINIRHTAKLPEYHTHEQASQLRRELNADHEMAEKEIAELLDQGYEVVNIASSEMMLHIMLVKHVGHFNGVGAFGLPNTPPAENDTD